MAEYAGVPDPSFGSAESLSGKEQYDLAVAVSEEMLQLGEGEEDSEAR